jgi:hypothetical protein
MIKIRKTCIISNMKTPNAIRKMIEAQPLGTVFASAAFLSTGPRAAVDQALYRMVKQGVLERVARGLYAAAGQSVQPQTAVLALANKTHEQLGLVWPSTVSDKFVVATSGQSRTLKMGKHVVQFRRMCQRKIRLASSPEGLVLLSLWGRGRENLTVLDIQQATKGWSEENIHAYAAQVPSWLYAGLKQAHAPRKSTKIGLSGAYDWSNPQIKDEVLIAKVLDKHKFEDVARLCFYFGVPKVKRVFKQHDFAPMASASVSRMLRNISKSLKPTTGDVYE